MPPGLEDGTVERVRPETGNTNGYLVKKLHIILPTPRTSNLDKCSTLGFDMPAVVKRIV